MYRVRSPSPCTLLARRKPAVLAGYEVRGRCLVQKDGGRTTAIYRRAPTSDRNNDRRERLPEHAERASFVVVEACKETLLGMRGAKGKQTRGARGARVIQPTEVEPLSRRETAKRLGPSKTIVNEILERRNRRAAGSGSHYSWRKILRDCSPLS